MARYFFIMLLSVSVDRMSITMEFIKNEEKKGTYRVWLLTNSFFFTDKDVERAKLSHRLKHLRLNLSRFLDLPE